MADRMLTEEEDFLFNPGKRKASGGPLSAQKRGQIASIRFNKLKPWSTWGAMRTERGTPASIGLFGETWKKANESQRANRKEHGFTGRGLYGMSNRAIGGMIGGYAGSMASPYLGLSRSTGRKYGSALGRMAVSGRGAYTLRGQNHVTNALINSANAPSMQSVQSHNGEILLTRSEFVQDITPTIAGFQSQFNCSLNPGLNIDAGGCFDWLSQIAQFYEQYEFVQVFFEYKSVVSPGNTTAAGTVIMTPLQTESNLYTDKVSMSLAQGQANAGVAEHILCGVECAPGQVYAGTVKRTRVSSVTDDLINYDLGQFQIATNGATANLNVGELWVHYTVKLSQPRFGAVGNSGNSLSTNPITECLIAGAASGSAVASQTSSALLGAVTTYATITDIPAGAFNEAQFGLAKLSTSSNYLYYTGTSDTSGTNFGSNIECLRFFSGYNYVNRQLIFSIKVVLGQCVSNSSTTPLSDITLRVGTTGNCSLVADAGGQNVRSSYQWSKLSLGTASVVTIAAGFELLYQFCLEFGDDDTLPTAIIYDMTTSQSEFVVSTTVANNMLITDISNDLVWNGSVQ